MIYDNTFRVSKLTKYCRAPASVTILNGSRFFKKASSSSSSISTKFLKNGSWSGLKDFLENGFWPPCWMLWYGSDLMLILALTPKYHKFGIRLWQKSRSHSSSSETLPSTLVFIKCHWLQILACLWLAHYANKIPISYFFLIFKGLVRPLPPGQSGGPNGVGGGNKGGPKLGATNVISLLNV